MAKPQRISGASTRRPRRALPSEDQLGVPQRLGVRLESEESERGAKGARHLGVVSFQVHSRSEGYYLDDFLEGSPAPRAKLDVTKPLMFHA